MSRKKRSRTKAENTLVQAEVPTKFLKEFDDFWPGKYASRSDAIRTGMEKIMEPIVTVATQPQLPAVGVPPQ